jgi:DNA transposition AAA+ family ATPase
MTIPSHNQELIVALESARTDDASSQTKLAKAIGCDAGTLNKWLNQKYPGNVAELEAKIEDYLRHRGQTRKLRTEIISTTVMSAVSSAINLARITGDKEGNISIIYGPAGCGKSKSAEYYCTQNPSTILAVLNDRTRDGKGVERSIMAAVETHGYKSNQSRWKWLSEKLRGSKRPILIDNAQRLNASGRAWLFDFQDETGCPIILIGNPEVLAPIKANDQFFSRFGFKTEVALEAKEISAVAHAVARQNCEFADDLRDLCAIVAKQKGGLRAVKKQCQLAQALHDNGIADPRKAFQAAHNKLIRDYTLPA